MALQKVAKPRAKGKFGSLTAAQSIKNQSIFGSNACKTVCSPKTAFTNFSGGGRNDGMNYLTNNTYSVPDFNNNAFAGGQPQQAQHDYDWDIKSYQAVKQELKQTNGNISFKS